MKIHPLGVCGKLVYGTIEEARTRAFYLEHISANHRGRLRAYNCSKCVGFHLTSKPFAGKGKP
jgi:hypothetical protein